MQVEETTPQMKRAPYRLFVDNPQNDDNSICAMNQDKMKELKIYNGDPVLLRGKRRNTTLCIAIKDNTLDVSKVGVNKVVRNNLRVKTGDLLTVKNAPEVPNLKKIHVLPYSDTIEGLTGNIA